MEKNHTEKAFKTLENQWLRLFIAPHLGGRLMQLEMADYPFFFVNPLLKDIEPNATRLGENGTWLNYGGEKIWVAPQGWHSSELWPGPPDPILDGGIFDVQEDENGITLTSPYDAHTGLQISRTVTLVEDAAEIQIRVRFENQSQIPRKWAIWPVCQVSTPDGDTVKIICPVNPNSVFSQGFKIVHGLVNNPQFNLNSAGHLAVDYQYLVGKVILDANAGWVASVNESKGKVLLMCYDFKSEQAYPDKASVHIWTQGKGMIYSRNKILTFADDIRQTPPYMEMELVSPMKKMEQGDFSEFDYQLKTTTIPCKSTVVEVREMGVIAEKLTIRKEENRGQIIGKYGVFRQGTIRLVVKNTLQILTNFAVSPLLGIEIAVNISPLDLNTSCQFDLEFWNEKGQLMGILDTVSN
jgi:Domain of unknown function (DUF4380)